MIGLEYICKLYNMQYKELADKLGVSKQIISIWIKKTRPIGKKHLPKLSEVFNLPEKYFQKELTDLEELEIQRLRLENEWIEEEYEEEVINPETGECEKDEDGKVIMKTRIYTEPGQERHYERLEYKSTETKMINKVKQTLSKQFHNAEKNEQMDDGLSDAYEILRLYEMFIEIIDKDSISRSTLRNVLKSLKEYENSELLENRNENNKNYDEEFIAKICNVINEEEDRKREEAKVIQKLFKEIDDRFK